MVFARPSRLRRRGYPVGERPNVEAGVGVGVELPAGGYFHGMWAAVISDSHSRSFGLAAGIVICGSRLRAGWPIYFALHPGRDCASDFRCRWVRFSRVDSADGRGNRLRRKETRVDPSDLAG